MNQPEAQRALRFAFDSIELKTHELGRLAEAVNTMRVKMIEAARVGEAGAGFAVVANEVHNLAQRATESARNTSELIDDIVSKVRDGERLAQATRGDFDEVTAAAAKVVALMAEIAAASQEQSQGIGRINKAVNEMSQVTQKNAAAAEELASAMAVFRTAAEG